MSATGKTTACPTSTVDDDDGHNDGTLLITSVGMPSVTMIGSAPPAVEDSDGHDDGGIIAAVGHECG